MAPAERMPTAPMTTRGRAPSKTMGDDVARRGARGDMRAAKVVEAGSPAGASAEPDSVGAPQKGHFETPGAELAPHR